MNALKNYCFVAIAFFMFSSLAAQEITMFPGFWRNQYYQDDKEISKKELDSLFLQHTAVNAHWQKARKLNTLGWVAIGAEYAFLTWALIDLKDREYNVVPTIGVIGSGVAALIFLLKSDKARKEAILTYNAKFDNKKSSFVIKPSDHGLGIVVEF